MLRRLFQAAIHLHSGVRMDFDYSTKVNRLREQLLAFMDEHIYPAEASYYAALNEAQTRWSIPPIMEELKKEGRRA
jgi:acyl-CoA dehydrogenase